MLIFHQPRSLRMSRTQGGFAPPCAHGLDDYAAIGQLSNNLVCLARLTFRSIVLTALDSFIAQERSSESFSIQQFCISLYLTLGDILVASFQSRKDLTCPSPSAFLHTPFSFASTVEPRSKKKIKKKRKRSVARQLGRPFLFFS